MLLLFVLTAAAGAGPAISRPVFEFRGLHARQAYVEDDPQFMLCKPLAAGPVCVLKDLTMGGQAVQQIGAAFGRDGLFAVEAKFSEEASPVIEASLREKYGAPCRSSIEHPFNAFGQHFTRRIRTWCFKDGEAVFKSMTDSASTGSFEFATFDAAKQAAVKDF